MFLPIGVTTYKYLRENDPQFDAMGMLGPTFTNKGDTIVFVNDEEVYPEDSFTTPENVIQQGNFNIQFAEKSAPADKNRLMVKYTKVIGVYDLLKKEIINATPCNSN